MREDRLSPCCAMPMLHDSWTNGTGRYGYTREAMSVVKVAVCAKCRDPILRLRRGTLIPEWLDGEDPQTEKPLRPAASSWMELTDFSTTQIAADGTVSMADPYAPWTWPASARAPGGRRPSVLDHRSMSSDAIARAQDALTLLNADLDARWGAFLDAWDGLNGEDGVDLGEVLTDNLNHLVTKLGAAINLAQRAASDEITASICGLTASIDPPSTNPHGAPPIYPHHGGEIHPSVGGRPTPRNLMATIKRAVVEVWPGDDHRHRVVFLPQAQPVVERFDGLNAADGEIWLPVTGDLERALSISLALGKMIGATDSTAAMMENVAKLASFYGTPGVTGAGAGIPTVTVHNIHHPGT